MAAADVAQAVVAFAMLLFVPGYAWALVLAPRVDGIARVALAIVLSVALVILTSYVGQVVLGIRITGVHALWGSLALTLVACGVLVAPRIDRALKEALEPSPGDDASAPDRPR